MFLSQCIHVIVHVLSESRLESVGEKPCSGNSAANRQFLIKIDLLRLIFYLLLVICLISHQLLSIVFRNNKCVSYPSKGTYFCTMPNSDTLPNELIKGFRNYNFYWKRSSFHIYYM